MASTTLTPSTTTAPTVAGMLLATDGTATSMTAPVTGYCTHSAVIAALGPEVIGVSEVKAPFDLMAWCDPLAQRADEAPVNQIATALASLAALMRIDLYGPVMITATDACGEPASISSQQAQRLAQLIVVLDA